MRFDDPRVPAWLHPFGGEVLIALIPADQLDQRAATRNTSAAGVGIKRHDRFGWVVAVGTEDRFAGQGLGRRLVAQAARRVITDGAVATYLHDPRNLASAKVAEAAGFPDRGWKVPRVSGPDREPKGPDAIGAGPPKRPRTDSNGLERK